MDFEWIWELRWLQNCSQKSFEPLQNLYKTFPRTHSVLSIQNDALPLTHYPITRPGGMGAAIKSAALLERRRAEPPSDILRICMLACSAEGELRSRSLMSVVGVVRPNLRFCCYTQCFVARMCVLL